MGYQVIYGEDGQIKKQKKTTVGIRTMTSICFVVFALLVRFQWPAGREMLLAYLMPDQQSITQAAFSDFMGNLRKGAAMADALTVFCKDLLYEVA